MVEMEETIKWVSDHYCSSHSILLVGDGDFSFSLSLANSFSSASNILATSLDSHDALLKKYSNARSNIEKLKELEATILHGIDATKMKLHTDLKMRKFDRIVFNFPHAGFKGKEDELHLINLHRSLILGFFNNSRQMLRPYGEIHVSHKTGDPYNKWNLEELAFKCSLILTGQVNFDIKDYPGYNNKRGDGKNCDATFHLGECCIFKFRSNLSLKPVKVRRPMMPHVEFRTFVPVSVQPPSVEFGTFVQVPPPKVEFRTFVPVPPPNVELCTFVPVPPPNVEFHTFIPVPHPNIVGTSYAFEVSDMVRRDYCVNSVMPYLGVTESLINEEHIRHERERLSYEREMLQRMLFLPPPPPPIPPTPTPPPPSPPPELCLDFLEGLIRKYGPHVEEPVSYVERGLVFKERGFI